MTSHNRYRKAFSLVEILVSMIILIIAIAATFTTYIATARLRIFAENELEAYYNAQSWLDRVRTGSSDKTRYTNLINQSKDLNDPDSIMQENYEDWHMAKKPKVNMTDTAYTIEKVSLTGYADPDDDLYAFKKISVEVKWEEPD
jgi:type II secretory pathway pseudopilin PulG